MMTLHSGFLFGTLCVIAGAFLLTYLDKIVKFDQNSGIKLKAFFGRKLRNSSLNRELWSVGTPPASRASKVAFRLVGATLVMVGVVILLFSFREHFH